MASGEVVLVNKSKRLQSIVLDHAAFRTKRYGFAIGSMEVTDHGADGTVSRRAVRRAVPGSITLLPGASSEPLHAAVRHVKQVKGLVARGDLAIEDAPDSKDQPASKDAESVQAGQRDGTLRRVRVEKQKGSDQ